MPDMPLRILIVEDHVEDSELVVNELRRAGLHITWQRVETETQYLNALGHPLDLIIADYTMPDFDALRAIDLLQERGLDIPFIVVSGTISDEVAVNCLKRGATDYLLKDRLARLGSAVISALAEKRLREEKRQAEAALQKSERRYRALIENSNDIFVIVDATMRLLYASPSAERILGYTPENMADRSLYDFIHPHDLPAFKDSLQTAIAHPGAAQPLMEHRARHRDGSWHYFETVITSLLEDANIGGIVVNAHDVTEHKLAEEARLNSEERLRAVIANLPVIVFAFDRDEVLTLIEGDGVETLGLNAEEMRGKPIPEAFRHSFQIVENYHRALAGESFISLIDLPNGPTFEVYYSALRNRQGEVSGAIGVAIDITERRMAEEALRTTELLQVKLDKEKELSLLKSRFVSMVTHEFRTPLTTILSSSDMLKTYSERLDDERKAEHLNKIQSQVKRLTALLEDILTINKAETVGVEFNPSPTDLETFCREFLSEYEDASSIHTLHFNVEGRPARASLDQKLLRQALSNIVSNAIKYSPDGGNVYFDLEYQPGKAIIRIRDEGIGIPEDDLNRLFEIFHRASNVRGFPGTGLGLIIVKNAVDAHSGRVSVESTMGVGTTFTIELPLLYI